MSRTFQGLIPWNADTEDRSRFQQPSAVTQILDSLVLWSGGRNDSKSLPFDS